MVAGSIHLRLHILATPDEAAPTFSMALIARTPVVYGGLLQPGEDTSAQLQTTLLRRRPDTPDTPLEAITLLDDGVSGRRLQAAKNDTGSASLLVQNDSEQLPSIRGRDLIAFDVRGRRALLMVIEDSKIVTLSPNDEVDEATTLTGRGHLQVMEEARVYPSGGVGRQPVQRDRPFNWTAASDSFDDSGWGTATVITTLGVATADWPMLPVADGMPDLSTELIGPHDGTITYARVGSWYTRHDFTAPYDSWYLFYAAADNVLELYVDAVLQATASEFQKVVAPAVYLTAGTHTIAARIENVAQPVPPNTLPTDFNPTMLGLEVYRADGNKVPIAGGFITSTDATWKIVEYPAYPPGMTPGAVLLVLLAEAQARGALLGVRAMFDELVDSNGLQWPTVGDIATKVGTDYLTFLKELTNSYIDVWMSPASLDLYCYVKGTRGAPRAFALTLPSDPDNPESGELLALQHDRAS